MLTSGGSQGGINHTAERLQRLEQIRALRALSAAILAGYFKHPVPAMTTCFSAHSCSPDSDATFAM